MKKLLFAIREEHVESAVAKLLSNEYEIVGSVPYREGIIPNISNLHPDVILLTESLQGSVSIDSIIYDIRVRFRNVRVVLLAGKHEPGDDFLSTTISRGVYDIIFGGTATIEDIVRKIREPASYADVAYLQDRDVSGTKNEMTDSLNYMITVPQQQVPTKKGLFSKLRKNKQEKELVTISQLDEETQNRLMRLNLAQNSQSFTMREQQNAYALPSNQSNNLPNTYPTYEGVIKTAQQPGIQAGPPAILQPSAAQQQYYQQSSNTYPTYSQPNYNVSEQNNAYPTYQKDGVKTEQMESSGNDKTTLLPPKQTTEKEQESEIGKTSILTSFDVYGGVEDVYYGEVESKKKASTPSYELPPVYIKPIVTVFGGTRAGVGTTQTVINTAQALSNLGKRVLVLDGVPGRSSLFQYLGLAHTEFGFDKALEGYMNGFTTNPDYYCYERENFFKQDEEEQYRLNIILHNIDYMRYSMSFSWRANDERLAFIGNYFDSIRGYYDHILIDVNFDSPDLFTKQFISVADNLVLVTTQDNFIIESFDTCECADLIKSFTEKKISVTNFYTSSLAYHANVAEKLNVSANIDTPVDITGYVSSSYTKIPYYYDVVSKSKDAFVELAKLL